MEYLMLLPNGFLNEDGWEVNPEALMFRPLFNDLIIKFDGLWYFVNIDGDEDGIPATWECTSSDYQDLCTSDCLAVVYPRWSEEFLRREAHKRDLMNEVWERAGRGELTDDEAERMCRELDGSSSAMEKTNWKSSGF